MEAFVYSWRNKENNRLYIGWHKGSPDDGYVCSSKVLMEEYKKNAEQFERYIIARGTAKDMVALESAILKAVDAKNNPEYYNQHNGDGDFSHTEKHTEEAKEKMSKAKLGKTRKHLITLKHRENMSKSAKIRAAQGGMKEAIKVSAEKRKGKPLSANHIEKISKSTVGKNLGKKRTPEFRKRMSESRIGVKRGPYKKRINNAVHCESSILNP